MAKQEQSVVSSGLEQSCTSGHEPVFYNVIFVPSDDLPLSAPCNILVTGVTGCGKSTLIAGISGETASSDHQTELGHADTTEILPVTCDFEEHIILWDTPGLLSGSRNPKRNLKQMGKKCQHRDFVIYCMKCTDARLISGNDNSAILSIRTLTEHFGTAFWTNAIFALTFANNLEYYRPAWKNLSTIEKEKKFVEEIREWESFIRKNLAGYAGVPQDIVGSVSVIPVGHYAAPTLMNRQNWIETTQESLCDKARTLSQGSSGKPSNSRKKTRPLS